MQNLWQAHYKILLILLLKVFRKFNSNIDSIVKTMKCAELNINTVGTALNTQKLKII